MELWIGFGPGSMRGDGRREGVEGRGRTLREEYSTSRLANMLDVPRERAQKY